MTLNKYILLVILIGFIFCNITSVISEVTIIRDLPDSVAKGSTFTVSMSIDVNESDLPYVLGVSENIPPGLIVSSVSSNGFNFSGDKVEWLFLEPSRLTQIIAEGITFVNPLEDQNITYTLKVPRDFSEDTAIFSGINFFGGTTNPTGGDVELAIIGIAGDANNDGEVNYLDITKVERIAAGLDTVPAGGNADANNDGEVNYLDITKVERIAAGLD